jgi:hypothetical protein
MIAGYDDDPREIWEFPEVCRYVRQWAKATGLDNPDVADLWLGSCEGGWIRRYRAPKRAASASSPHAASSARRCAESALSDHNPTTEQ